MKKKLFLMIALLCAVVQGAWADETTTILDENVFTRFTATGGSNTGDGGYDKLVDGSTNTKWCTNSSPFWVEFHSSGLFTPTGYILTTGGDTQSYSGRNPRSWTIKAKVNAGDEWTTLVTETDNESMPASNLTPVEFTITGNTTAYKYFRFEVSATRGDSWFQLTEFRFKGTTTDNGNFIMAPLSGSGTSESPYTISSANDWDLFAYYVNSGTKNYNNEYVQLTANVSGVTTMVGNSENNSFQGTFDGNNKTLTVTIGTSESAFNEENCAPFRYVKNATIQNLKVTGNIRTNQKLAAGLAARPYGTTTISNCHVSTVIYSSKNGDGAHGGIVAMPSGTLNIDGCSYTGRLLTNNSTNNCSGFVGWFNNTTVSITNSLYAPDSNIPEGWTAINHENTFVRGANPTLTDCYFTEALGNAQGAQVYTNIPANEIYKPVTAADGKTYYAVCIVSDVDEYYKYTGSTISITPTVSVGGTALIEGTNYTLAFSPATVQAAGSYTLTITGKGTWSGSKTINFYVIIGNGNTADDPIIINCTDDWNTFATNVNNGNNYSGKFLKLTKDISVSTMVGTAFNSTPGNGFSGTFDGNGHTLTINLEHNNGYDSQLGQGISPFRYINGATIKNLTTAGNVIFTGKQADRSHASGLVGFADGTNLIENCVVKVYFELGFGFDKGGGFVGNGRTSTTTIKDCVFAGSFFATAWGKFRGFWGYDEPGSTPIIINCLEKTTRLGNYSPVRNIDWHPIGRRNQGSTGSVSDTYYITAGSTATFCTDSKYYQVYANRDDKFSKMVTAADGNTYFIYCTFSGIRNNYTYTGSVIPVTFTIKDNNSMLTEGTDYTYAISPSTVQQQGDYELTIITLGNPYCGTQTLNFTVTDYLVQGKFTVNANGDMVKFTRSNLQATTSDLGTNWIWDIANSQTTYVGNAAANNKINGAGTVSENGTVDLFCWVGSASAHTGAAQYGITFSNNNNDLGGSSNEHLKSDWGNLIGEGYRTLSNDEWDYLLNTRESGSTVNGTENARYTHATVNGVNGVIIFPDGVKITSSAVDLWGAINTSSEWGTKCNAAQWTALEARGCVFLPTAGCRYVTQDSGSNNQPYMKVSSDGERGFYWANTCRGEKADALTVSSNRLYIEQNTSRYQGGSVRLVKDFVMPYEGNRTLTDADTYSAMESVGVASAIYKKSTDRVGKCHSWFLPFDHTITATDAAKFSFYKIYMIANAIAPDATMTDDIWIYVRPMQEGDVLYANMPYIYKPLEAVTDYEFTTANAMLKYPKDGPLATLQTMEDTYTLYGIYEPTTATVDAPFYYMNINGALSLGNDGNVTVGAFRWIMRQESKFGGSTPVAYAREIHFFDGESNETTGIVSLTPDPSPKDEESYYYTLDGRKINGKPTAKGMYIHHGVKRVIK